MLWLYRPTTFSSSVDAAEKRSLIIGHVRWQGEGVGRLARVLAGCAQEEEDEGKEACMGVGGFSAALYSVTPVTRHQG